MLIKQVSHSIKNFVWFRIPTIIYCCLFIGSTCVFLFCCDPKRKSDEQLAKQHCGSCHLFPEPGLLTKSIWKNEVLPNMAFRMGLLNLMEGAKYAPLQDLVTVASTLPGSPMVTQDEWQSIVNYFVSNAPDTLVFAQKEKIRNLEIFQSFHYADSEETIPLVTLVYADTIHHKLFVGNRNGKITQLTNTFKTEKTFQFSSPASHLMYDQEDGYLISLMGIMDPNDQLKGELIQLKSENANRDLILDSLKRPVYFEKADLNGDGSKDYIVCMFGNYTGALVAFESDELIGYRKHLISPLPGTRRTLIKDFNGDGLPDIIALFTQGDEQIILFMNEGNFNFKQKTLLRFPPVYGSTYFDIADFNHDGKFDILYTNGDNSDYSQILKPYHGVRIFTQQSDFVFKETWFYPMHGASKAITTDFDLDGDLDIASISFFPDFENHAEESFIYFQNSNGKFTARSLPDATSGRWIVMEVADIEGDGDQDILLGALDFNSKVPDPLFQHWEEKRTSILLLKNILR
ncbi:MAG: VCBS repeat-containing protein [Cyclobacteriaceae bacterium]|nr:VCBS repeat-containing protein [Cyclobacteriaceae bacterium]